MERKWNAAVYSDILNNAGVHRLAIVEILNGVNALQYACHHLSTRSGWWHKLVSDANPNPVSIDPFNPDVFGCKIALIHSEISEAMEGGRKNKMDDHLPHRKSEEVELADAIIRIMDLAGARNLDVAGAIVEKLAYNQQRADHKPENRAADGGKKF